MKKILVLFVILCNAVVSFAQPPDPFIITIINQTNLDSLSKFVNELSGEDSTFVNGEKVLIEHRISWQGNDLAADYIKQKLESYGLTAYDQDFNATGGRNVYAVQQGTIYPDEKYIICAHYDAVDYFCADDNASGTAAVLEAARINSNFDFPYTIVYALWDEEEVGLYGSAYYASEAASNNEIINGVINLDMIAWDSDDDGMYEIHSSNTANSGEVAATIQNVNTGFNLNISPDVYNPGTPYSDHSSFWDNGYGAVLLIEGYYGGDFNPYYHTANDRISIFNLDYFHEMAKLSIGSIATLAYSGAVPYATFDPLNGTPGFPVDSSITITFNMPMRNIDDSPITDPTGLVTFKKEGPSGENVEYSASINDNKTVITVTPVDSLEYDQEYFVEMPDTVENYFDIRYGGGNITFTTEDDEGIYALQSSDIKMYPNPAKDYIKLMINKPVNEKIVIELRDLSGHQIIHHNYTGNNEMILDISDLNPGMYLVNIKGATFSMIKKISVL